MKILNRCGAYTTYGHRCRYKARQRLGMSLYCKTHSKMIAKGGGRTHHRITRGLKHGRRSKLRGGAGPSGMDINEWVRAHPGPIFHPTAGLIDRIGGLWPYVKTGGALGSSAAGGSNLMYGGRMKRRKHVLRRRGGRTAFARLAAAIKSKSRRRGYPLRSASAVAAAIGRRKYGKSRFQAMALAGRRKKLRGKSFWSDFLGGIRKGADIVSKPLQLAGLIPGIGAVARPISAAVEGIRLAHDISRGEGLRGGRRKHSARFERCVRHLKASNRKRRTKYNPYAVCTKSTGGRMRRRVRRRRGGLISFARAKELARKYGPRVAGLATLAGFAVKGARQAAGRRAEQARLYEELNNPHIYHATEPVNIHNRR